MCHAASSAADSVVRSAESRRSADREQPPQKRREKQASRPLQHKQPSHTPVTLAHTSVTQMKRLATSVRREGGASGGATVCYGPAGPAWQWCPRGLSPGAEAAARTALPWRASPQPACLSSARSPAAPHEKGARSTIARARSGQGKVREGRRGRTTTASKTSPKVPPPRCFPRSTHTWSSANSSDCGITLAVQGWVGERETRKRASHCRHARSVRERGGLPCDW